jgi:hypothetical protein
VPEREKENEAGACFTARRITGNETSSSHAANTGEEMTAALFIWLIIHLIQLVFSAGTVFFSPKKSANNVF